MALPAHIPLETFKEVSVTDKARALTMFGTMIASVSSYGVDFFLYSIDNYFVEVAARASTPASIGGVIYIKATDHPAVMDMYLDYVSLPHL